MRHLREKPRHADMMDRVTDETHEANENGRDRLTKQTVLKITKHLTVV